MGKPKVKMKLVIGKVYYFDESRKSFGKYVGVTRKKMTGSDYRNVFQFKIIELDESIFMNTDGITITFSIESRNRFILKA